MPLASLSVGRRWRQERQNRPGARSALTPEAAPQGAARLTGLSERPSCPSVSALQATGFRGHSGPSVQHLPHTQGSREEEGSAPSLPVQGSLFHGPFLRAQLREPLGTRTLPRPQGPGAHRPHPAGPSGSVTTKHLLGPSPDPPVPPGLALARPAEARDSWRVPCAEGPGAGPTPAGGTSQGDLRLVLRGKGHRVGRPSRPSPPALPPPPPESWCWSAPIALAAGAPAWTQ